MCEAKLRQIWTNICFKVFHQEMIHARHPRPQAPCLQSWSVREKLRGDSVCECWLHRTGSNAAGKRRAAASQLEAIQPCSAFLKRLCYGPRHGRSTPAVCASDLRAKLVAPLFPECYMLLKTLRSGEALVSEQSLVWGRVTCQRSTQLHRGPTPFWMWGVIHTKANGISL